MANTHSIDLERSSSQYLSQADAGDISGNATFEMWVKLESAPASGESMSLFKCVDRGNSVNASFGANYLNEAGTLKLQFYRDRAGVAYSRIIVAQTLTIGVWYHIAMTYDGTTLRGYVNAREVVNGAMSGTGSASAQEFLWIGNGEANIGSGVFFDGLIDEFRQWTTARTAAQISSDARIQDIADASVIGEWSLDNAYTDSSGSGRTLTANASPVFSTDRPWVTATQIGGSTYLETNLIAHWEFESGAITTDSKGAYTLTNNNSVTNATGKQGDAADFESGSSQSLTLAADSAFLPAAYSISCWINKESNSGLNAIWSKEASGVGYVFYTNGTDLSITHQGVDTLTITGAISTATWHHVVVSWDGTTIRVFIDGRERGIVVASLVSSTAQQAIGNRSSGVSSGYFDGLIDELSFYQRGLHYGDVLDLYNAGSGIPYSNSIAYNLAVTVGAFTLTGIATTFLQALRMTGDLATFTLTGIDNALSIGKGIVADVASFTLTGIDTLYHVTLSMATTVGEFVLTGIDTVLTRTIPILAESASFVLTGTDTAFRAAISMAGAVGEFVLTGVSATLTYGRVMIATVATFTLTGFAIRVPILWRNLTKNVESWLNPTTKHSASVTNLDKTNNV
jgi:hypothetical protein